MFLDIPIDIRSILRAFKTNYLKLETFKILEKNIQSTMLIVIYMSDPIQILKLVVVLILVIPMNYLKDTLMEMKVLIVIFQETLTSGQQQKLKSFNWNENS